MFLLAGGDGAWRLKCFRGIRRAPSTACDQWSVDVYSADVANILSEEDVATGMPVMGEVVLNVDMAHERFGVEIASAEIDWLWLFERTP